MYKSTVYTILGVLAMEPMSGYEIKKVLNDSTKHFWSESAGQIYPALKTALNDGLIDIHQQADSRSKVSYTITDDGKEVLDSWLRLAPEKFTMRNELLLKVFFGNNTDEEVTISYLEEHLIKINAKLRTFQSLEKAVREHVDQKINGAKYWYIAVKHGLHSLEASKEWAKQSIEFIKNN